MERKKKNKLTLFAAIFLLAMGTIGVFYAMPMSASAEETPMTLTSVSVTATTGGISTTSALMVVSDGNITTAGINTNAFIDSDILIKFSQYVTDDENTRSKISLQKIKTDGTFDSNIVTNSGISIANKNLTINPSVDLQMDKYYLVTMSPGVQVSGSAIYSTTTYQAIFKTGTKRLVPLEPETVTFSAISLFPTESAKDVPVDSDFTIGFTETIKANNDITNGLAIELIDPATSATFPAVFTVSSDRKSITVNPVDALAYGKEYQLKIVSGMIKNADKTSTLSESFITFKTTSFSQVTASAITSGATGAGLDIDVSLLNASANEQNGKVSYVVRRDKGARLEDGGTVVTSGTSSMTCTANQTTTVQIDLADITADLYGNPLTRAVYVDIYITNNSGNLLADPIHIAAHQL